MNFCNVMSVIVSTFFHHLSLNTSRFRVLYFYSTSIQIKRQFFLIFFERNNLFYLFVYFCTIFNYLFIYFNIFTTEREYIFLKKDREYIWLVRFLLNSSACCDGFYSVFLFSVELSHVKWLINKQYYDFIVSKF